MNKTSRILPVAKLLRQITDEGRPPFRFSLVARHPGVHCIAIRKARHFGLKIRQAASVQHEVPLPVNKARENKIRPGSIHAYHDVLEGQDINLSHPRKTGTNRQRAIEGKRL